MNCFLQKFQLPGKNIAIAFSDQAGANACMAIPKILKDKTYRLFSNKEYPSVGSALIERGWPDLYGVDTVFLGTSHPESSACYELFILKEAKYRGIYSISFIDHWTNFLLRFMDAGNDLTFPDEIWVVDEVAKRLAIVDGLPANKIRISGNPYHVYLSTVWQPTWNEKGYLSTIGLTEDGFHILFAPDPITLRNRNNEYGFTEATALRDLLRVVQKIGDRNLRIIVKCHPLQPVEILQDILEESNFPNVHILKQADNLELIHASDVVLGFYSNMLLDARAIGKRVLRYFPGKDNMDMLAHTFLEKARDEADLYCQLKRIVYE